MSGMQSWLAAKGSERETPHPRIPDVGKSQRNGMDISDRAPDVSLLLLQEAPSRSARTMARHPGPFDSNLQRRYGQYRQHRRKGARTLGEYRVYLEHLGEFISEPSAIPASTVFVISTEEWPRVEILNPQLQEPFLKLLAQQEAVALAFKGINVTERRRQIQAQKVEVSRRFA
jgi:hypothetical protein